MEEGQTRPRPSLRNPQTILCRILELSSMKSQNKGPQNNLSQNSTTFLGHPFSQRNSKNILPEILKLVVNPIDIVNPKQLGLYKNLKL